MADGGGLPNIQDGDRNPEIAVCRRRVFPRTCIQMYETTIKVAIGIFALVVCNVLVIRTLTLVIVPLLEVVAKNPCSLNSTTSTPRITSMVYSSSSEYIRRLSVFMMVIITVLQWPAHGYLLYYFYKFFAPAQQQQANQVEEGKYKWATFICRQCCKGALVVLSLTVLTVASVLTMSGDIVKLTREQGSLACEDYPPLPYMYARRILTYVYYVATIFTYMLEVAERYLMVCFTAFVGTMWHDGYETRRNEMEQNRPNNAQPDTNGYVDEFNKIVDCVKPIYKIFRSFFVFQWLVHVYLLFTQLVHLLYPWIKDGRSSFMDTTESYTSTFHANTAAVIFYTLALLIAYVCGLKMNSYRRRYIRKSGLTHKQLLKYDRENKSIFTPRVPGTGLSISLESPGYMLGVVLTMFGLVGALLAM